MTVLYWFLKHLPLGHPRRKGSCQGFTLAELLLTILIVGTLAAIAVPAYTGYINKQRNATSKTDIANIESQIERFRALNGRPPNGFAEAGIAAQNDPWGRPYSYLRIAGLPPADWQGLCRRDRSLNPLNADYDLYCNGRDGLTTKNINDAASWDDIIRANNGTYVGVASEY